MFESPFWYRIRKKMKWEFFPIWAVYGPVAVYYLYLSAKSRSLTFFSASNPGIENGGMFAESKYGIIRNLDPKWLPKTAFFPEPVDASRLFEKMQELGLDFPVVLKPDMGERGDKVAKIKDVAGLSAYLADNPRFPLILQDWISLPEEFAIAYHRMPGEREGQITSITAKGFLSVCGDGHSTLLELIRNCERCRFHFDMLTENFRDRLDEVLAAGEVLQLNVIGNHCKGTTFFNANHLLTPDLHKVFDPVADQIEGFFFGRFDLKAESFEALQEGKFLIMEVNASGAEPGHIYAPDMPVLDSYRDLLRHWRNMYEVAARNFAAGAEKVPFSVMWQRFFRYRRMMRG